MARPDLSQQRSAEILDAFERCVAKHGIFGSTLAKVAEEAGMRRSILRHYIGNRDDLVNALALRVMAKYRADMKAAFAGMSEDSCVCSLLDYLFPERPYSDAQSLMVIESLIAAAEHYPVARDEVTTYLDELTEQTASLLQRAYPDALRGDCWTVAYGVIGICFNHDSLSPLGLDHKYGKAAREAARRLLLTLGV